MSCMCVCVCGVHGDRFSMVSVVMERTSQKHVCFSGGVELPLGVRKCVCVCVILLYLFDVRLRASQ